MDGLMADPTSMKHSVSRIQWWKLMMIHYYKFFKSEFVCLILSVMQNEDLVHRRWKFLRTESYVYYYFWWWKSEYVTNLFVHLLKSNSYIFFKYQGRKAKDIKRFLLFKWWKSKKTWCIIKNLFKTNSYVFFYFRMKGAELIHFS